MGFVKRKINIRTVSILLLLGLGLVIFIAKTICTPNVLLVRFDIHQDKDAIYLSTFAEPPQFAIWIENNKTGEKQTVFVTYRSGMGDWEGKPSVPVAIPRWSALFAANKEMDDGHKMDAVSGATPKEGFFSISTEIPEGSSWNCWIEMNLAGDFNDSFPALDEEAMKEDEFFCGQPALLYHATINAKEGFTVIPKLTSQSVWDNGTHRIEPISDGVTTARKIFKDIKISIVKRN